MLRDELRKQITDALKSGDSTRVSTLRLLANALHNEEIAKHGQLTPEDEIAVVKRQLKQREEAVEALRQAQGKLTTASSADLESRADKEGQEAEILKEYLPEQMSVEQIGELVDQVVKELETKEFGQVMGEVMKRVGGKADGKLVAAEVKSKLGN